MLNLTLRKESYIVYKIIGEKRKNGGAEIFILGKFELRISTVHAKFVIGFDLKAQAL